ncbi:unnamed protein product [Albugo candida]|uniref:C2 NT-type domain-containing protein n=1 Tax=Albugo candida TaxID=65357 RepID=A0A024FTF9_9STRA|nr:unnamed protein product [Albugo candida]|eukprot:CCI10393.1 unnamed protein product [Albugo candida]
MAQLITAYPHTRAIRKASVLTSASHVSQYTFARSSTVPYQKSSEAASVGESSTASTSMLVNINLYLKNATVGRDISPNDTELLVLFRRNSKEITSQSTQWNDDHSAVWNENIPIQTSLLPNMHTESNINGNAVALHPKEYDIVLVALPSHSAVAVFSFDFAEMVQSQIAQEIREHSYRISPLKCRDLAATLEFHIDWEFAQYVPNTMTIPGSEALHVSSAQAVFETEIPRKRRPRNHSLQPILSHSPDVLPRRVSSAHPPARSVPSLSQCSQVVENCHQCKSLHERLERRNTRIVKMETELKEAQKKVQVLLLATEELAMREAAECKNAARYRAVSIRMLTEMEIGHCMWLQNKPSTPSIDLSSHIRFWLQELDACNSDSQFRISGSRNSVASTASTSSSQKSSRSDRMADRVIDDIKLKELLGRARHLMEQAQIVSYTADKDDDACSTITSISQQMNAFEKENRELRAQVNDLQISSQQADSKEDRDCEESTRISALEAEVEKVRAENQAYAEQVDNLSGRLYRHTEASTLSQSLKAPSFLTKIYKDVGKAKVVLEAQLKQQKHQSTVLEVENKQLRARLLELEPCHTLAIDYDETNADPRDGMSRHASELEALHEAILEKVEQVQCMERLQAILNDREAQIVSLDRQLYAYGVSSTSQIDTLTTQLKACRQELQLQSNEWERLQSQFEAVEREKKALEMNVAVDGDMEERKQPMEHVWKEMVEEMRVSYEEIVAEKKVISLQLQRALDALRQQQDTRTDTETELRLQIEALQSRHTEEINAVQVQLSDVSKQLKMSRQEVMEFRFRSNQLESLTCKYDQIVSEKNAFEAKILALQGQLYDQRDRVLSSSVEYIHCNAESKQIQLCRMEEQLCDFQVQLGILQERNQTQAIRIDELTIQHRRMCSEKEALNGIVDQLIAEKDNFEQLVSLDQNAIRTESHTKRSQSVTETNIPCRNVADLIKNFS